MSLVKSGIKRIKIATISVQDINQFESYYINWLDYKVISRSKISQSMERSWGVKGYKGTPFILLAPNSGEDVFIRAVQAKNLTEVVPLTHLGWSAIELVVSDVDIVARNLINSPFKIIGPPKALTDGSPIKAMQIIGPANEVIYLTSSSGKRSDINHPEPKGLIGRIFIAVMAVNNIKESKEFYIRNMMFDSQGDLSLPIEILSLAQKKELDYNYNISVLTGIEVGNKVELDEYENSFKIQKISKDSLPSAISMMTFEVTNLDLFDLDFLSHPTEIYPGFKSGVFLGPSGERWELLSKIY